MIWPELLTLEASAAAAVSSPGVRASAGSNAACAGRYADPAAASSQTRPMTTGSGAPSASASAAAPVAAARDAAVSARIRSRLGCSASCVVHRPASAAGAKRKPTSPTASAPPAA